MQNADGDTRTMGVPPDMKSFDTLKVGDHVDVDYSESIAVALMPAGTKSSMSETTSGGRTGAAGRRHSRPSDHALPSRSSASTR